MEPHQGNTNKTLILDSVSIETDADRTQGSVKRPHRIPGSTSRMRETRSVYPTCASVVGATVARAVPAAERWAVRPPVSSVKRPPYQVAIIALSAGAAAVIAVGALLDAMSNAMSLISSTATRVCTVVLLVLWLLIEVTFRLRPVRWVTSGGQVVLLSRLGFKSRSGLVGVLLLLWLPRVATPVPEPSKDIKRGVRVETASPLPSPSRTEPDVDTPPPPPIEHPSSSTPEKTARTEPKSKDHQTTITQSIVNSLGAVQALGDVTITAPPARRISPAQREKLMAALHGVQSGVISIGCNLRGGDEPCVFARELAELLRGLGWRVSVGEVMGWGPPDALLCESCFVVRDSKSPVAQFGVPLEAALRDVGYNATHVFREDASDTELRLDINALHPKP